MKGYQFHSIARILVLVIVAATLLCTQIPAVRKPAIQCFYCEVCLLLAFVLTSLISWRRYF